MREGGSGRTKGGENAVRHWEFLTAVSFERQSPLPGAISEGEKEREERERVAAALRKEKGNRRRSLGKFRGLI